MKQSLGVLFLAVVVIFGMRCSQSSPPQVVCVCPTPPNLSNNDPISRMLFPKGIIYYYYDPHIRQNNTHLETDLNDAEFGFFKSVCEGAMRVWENKSHHAVSFVEMKNNDITNEDLYPHVLEISYDFDAKDSESQIALDPAAPNIIKLIIAGVTFNSDDQEFRSTVKHELGHSLGLIHEHQRTDAAEHLCHKSSAIKLISGGLFPNNDRERIKYEQRLVDVYFKKQPITYTNSNYSYTSAPFDLGSLMMYESNPEPNIGTNSNYLSLIHI